MENGLVLAATGAKGMPLVVEISVAFSVLVAVFVFSIFAFRIRERFDSVDADILNRFREEAVVTTGIRDLFNMAAISAAGNFHGEDGT